MTQTYDPAKVDALLNSLDGLDRGLPSDVLSAIAALRPKPAKFYVMPEWETLVHPNTKADVVLVNDDRDVVYKSIYNALRELTATDKPMVHIPASDDWDQREINALNNVWVGERRYNTNADWRAIIDHIKAKLEGA